MHCTLLTKAAAEVLPCWSSITSHESNVALRGQSRSDASTHRVFPTSAAEVLPRWLSITPRKRDCRHRVEHRYHRAHSRDHNGSRPRAKAGRRRGGELNDGMSAATT